MEIDYFKEENEYVRKYFNLEDILSFQLKNDIQIIRGEDYQYSCYINKTVYSTALTPIYALITGIKIYKTDVIYKKLVGKVAVSALQIGHRINGETLPADEFRRIRKLYIFKELKKLKSRMSEDDYKFFKQYFINNFIKKDESK